MATLLTEAYCNGIKRDCEIPKDIINICCGYIGQRECVLYCSKCKKILKITEFSKSQKSKRLSKCKCKQCIQSYHTLKKRKPKTAKKPFEISIDKCKEAIISSFHSELKDSYFGVIVANIILSYSHILIEGIYRFGHNDDEQWRKLKNQSEIGYKMHKLILKPIENNTIGGQFRWQYEYYYPKYPVRGCSECNTSDFDVYGIYNINIISDKNKIGGKTEIELSRFQSRCWSSMFSYRQSGNELVAVIDCDRDLVMSFKNKEEYGQDINKTPHPIWTKDIETGFLELKKLIHSVWVIPS